MELHKSLYKIQDLGFNFFIFVTYFCYILFALGIFTKAPQYLSTLDYYIKIYISLFLLWRFHPFQTIQFTDLDRKISFSAGIFLLTTSALNQILIKYLDNAKNAIHNVQNNFVSKFTTFNRVSPISSGF
jgi:hypothetical protein